MRTYIYVNDDGALYEFVTTPPAIAPLRLVGYGKLTVFREDGNEFSDDELDAILYPLPYPRPA